MLQKPCKSICQSLYQAYSNTKFPISFIIAVDKHFLPYGFTHCILLRKESLDVGELKVTVKICCLRTIGFLVVLERRE